MRVFVTGASGFIGSAVVSELIDAGHQVVGLARSDSSAWAVEAAGARAHLGDLANLKSLRAGAESADGVIHLAFNHDFSDFAGSGQMDRRAIETIGEALAGSDRPFVVTSGLAGHARGVLSRKTTRPHPGCPAHRRRLLSRSPGAACACRWCACHPRCTARVITASSLG
jgi:nucleoside-diphosphate-sugar epimerase